MNKKYLLLIVGIALIVIGLLFKPYFGVTYDPAIKKVVLTNKMK